MLFEVPPLSWICAQVTFRCSESMRLPRWKGAMFRGGLGRALWDSYCAPTCAELAACAKIDSCLYRLVFAPETSDPRLKGAHDAPRPFIIRPPLDDKTHFEPNDTLTFEIIVTGWAVQLLPYLITAFHQLGQKGLGSEQGRADLIRVETYHPQTGERQVFLEHGAFTNQAIVVHAADLVSVQPLGAQTLTLNFRTPTRIKTQGQWLRIPECSAILNALIRRLRLLSQVYGTAPWEIVAKPLLQQADGVVIDAVNTRWVEWGRTSGATGQHMQFGGIVGSVTYRAVPPDIIALLRLGTLAHVGKACVFGHGWYGLREESAAPIGRSHPRP